MIAQADEDFKLTARYLGGANVNEEFFYIAGPMSNYPGFNFDAFHATAKVLRDQGYNVVNPAELDHEIARAAKSNAEGSHKLLTATLAEQGIDVPTWADCLDRDLQIIRNPNCVGVIAIEGWEHSQGAQWETYTAYKLFKPIYVFSVEAGVTQSVVGDTPTLTPHLTLIDRRDALDAAGVRD